MKKTIFQPKKLALRRESIRTLTQLTDRELAEIAGGDAYPPRPTGQLITRCCR
jgi:hypothetical protein